MTCAYCRQALPQNITGLLNLPIAHLNLSARALMALRNKKIILIYDLVSLSRNELSRLPHIGKKTTNEIVEKLKTLGFHI